MTLQITPKGRGRPRKSKVDEDAEEEFDEDSEDVNKKKRGRKRVSTGDSKSKKSGGKVPTLKIKLGKRKKDTSVSLVRLVCWLRRRLQISTFFRFPNARKKESTYCTRIICGKWEIYLCSYSTSIVPVSLYSVSSFGCENSVSSHVENGVIHVSVEYIFIEGLSIGN